MRFCKRCVSGIVGSFSIRTAGGTFEYNSGNGLTVYDSQCFNKGGHYAICMAVSELKERNASAVKRVFYCCCTGVMADVVDCSCCV